MLQNFIFETIATESDDVTKVTNFYFSQFLEISFLPESRMWEKRDIGIKFTNFV